VVGRSVADWVSDVSELCDQLEIGRVGVIGASGGVPYALAVGAFLSERVSAVCASNSNSATSLLPEYEHDEEDREMDSLIRRIGPEAATAKLVEQNREWAAGLSENPSSLLDDLPDCDRTVLLANDLEAFEASVRESVRQGAIGAYGDWVALSLPWGFSLDEVAVTTSFWFGAQDTLVSEVLFRRIADLVPRSTFTVFDDAGHFVFAKHFDKLLAAAAGDRNVS
jgi:pimeloyl-ACP methyl ester carboxylesterase